MIINVNVIPQRETPRRERGKEMASTGKCPYCGGVVRSDAAKCPGCGAPNELYVADTPRTIFQPKTIEELQEYCAERGMPLLRMRFFIGEDFKEPRAFGIYRDGNNVVVYKNKADGSRAIRYSGPDEARGVGELYQKLLQECHNRGIYPDGKPAEPVSRSGSGGASGGRKRGKRNLPGFILLALFLAVMLVFSAMGGISNHRRHAYDGYYAFSDEQVYYRYGDDWYASDYGDEENDWDFASFDPPEDYEDYKLGSRWDSDWGVGDFKDSDTWEYVHPSSSGSSSYDDDYDSDYDDWDSGDTDWDSDW